MIIRRKVELYVRYGDDTYRVAKAVVTDLKVVVVPQSTHPGEHITYPEDGQVHVTRPPLDYDFGLLSCPPLSNVTFQVFHEIELSSTGPPPNWNPTDAPSTNAFVIDAPSKGTAVAFAAVVDSTDADQVQAHLESLTSASTYRIATGRAATVLLGWMPEK